MDYPDSSDPKLGNEESPALMVGVVLFLAVIAGICLYASGCNHG